MMPSFAFGRSNNDGLVEGKRTENSPWFDGHEEGEGSIAKMYDCISFFVTIMISLFPIGEQAANHRT